MNTQLELLHELTDVAAVVPHAELTLDDGGEALGGPDVTLKPERLGAPSDKPPELGAFVEREFPLANRRFAAAQTVSAAIPAPLYPLAHGAVSDTQGAGNVALGPARLLQIPRLQAAKLGYVGTCSLREGRFCGQILSSFRTQADGQ